MSTLELTPITSQNSALASSVGAIGVRDKAPSAEWISKAIIPQIQFWIDHYLESLDYYLAKMTSKQISELDVGQIKALGKEINYWGIKLHYILPETIAQLTSKELTKIQSSLVRYVNISKLSGLKIARSGTEFVNGLVPSQVNPQKIINILFNLPSANIKDLTLGMMEGLSWRQLVRVFQEIGPQIAAMTVTQLRNYLTPMAAFHLEPETLALIPAATLHGLFQGQIRAFNLSAMTGPQLAAIVNDMSEDQVMALGTGQLADFLNTMALTAFEDLRYDFFTLVRPRALITALNALYATNRARFNDLFQEAFTFEQIQSIFGAFSENAVSPLSNSRREAIRSLVSHIPAQIFALLDHNLINHLSTLALQAMTPESVQDLVLVGVTADTFLRAGLPFIQMLGGPQLLAMSFETAMQLFKTYDLHKFPPAFIGGLSPDVLVDIFDKLGINAFLSLSSQQIAALSLPAINALASNSIFASAMFDLGYKNAWNEGQITALFSISGFVVELDPTAFNFFSVFAVLSLSSSQFADITADQLQVILNNPSLQNIFFFAGTNNVKYLTRLRFETLSGAALAGMTGQQFLRLSMGVQILSSQQIDAMSRNPDLAELFLGNRIGYFLPEQYARIQSISGMLNGRGVDRGLTPVVGTKFQVMASQINAQLLAIALVSGLNFPNWTPTFIRAIPANIFQNAWELAFNQIFDVNNNLRTDILSFSNFNNFISSLNRNQLNNLLYSPGFHKVLIDNLINGGVDGIATLVRIVNNSDFLFHMSILQVQNMIAVGDVGLNALANFANIGAAGFTFDENFLNREIVNSIINSGSSASSELILNFVQQNWFYFDANALDNNAVNFLLNLTQSDDLTILAARRPEIFSPNSLDKKNVDFILSTGRSLLLLNIFRYNQSAFAINVLSKQQNLIFIAILENDISTLVDFSFNHPDYFLPGILDSASLQAIAAAPNGNAALKNIINYSPVALTAGSLIQPLLDSVATDIAVLNNIAINNVAAFGVGTIRSPWLADISPEALTAIAVKRVAALASESITEAIAMQLLMGVGNTPPLLNVIMNNPEAIRVGAITAAVVAKLDQANFGDPNSIGPIALLAIKKPKAFAPKTITASLAQKLAISLYEGSLALTTLGENNPTAFAQDSISWVVLTFVRTQLPNISWSGIARIAIDNPSAFAIGTIDNYILNNIMQLANAGEALLSLEIFNHNIFLGNVLNSDQIKLLKAINNGSGAIVLAMMENSPTAFFRGVLNQSIVELILNKISAANARKLIDFLLKKPQNFASGSVGVDLLERISAIVVNSTYYSFIENCISLLTRSAVASIPMHFFLQLNTQSLYNMLGNQNFLESVLPAQISRIQGALTRGILQRFAQGNIAILNSLSQAAINYIDPSEFGYLRDNSGNIIPGSDPLFGDGSNISSFVRNAANFLNRLSPAQAANSFALLRNIDGATLAELAINAPNFLRNNAANLAWIPVDAFAGLTNNGFLALWQLDLMNNLRREQINQIPENFFALMDRERFVAIDNRIGSTFLAALNESRLAVVIGNATLRQTLDAPGGIGELSIAAVNGINGTTLAAAYRDNQMNTIPDTLWACLLPAQQVAFTGVGITPATRTDLGNNLTNPSTANANRLLTAATTSIVPLLQMMAVTSSASVASMTPLSATASDTVVATMTAGTVLLVVNK